MRKKFWIFVFVVALVVFVFLFWHRSKMPMVVVQPALTKQTTVETNQPTTTNSNKLTPVRLTPEEIVIKSNKAVAIKSVQWEQDIAAKNMPVAFFGQFVDQNNEPISGVKVTMNVRHQEYSLTTGPHANYPTKEFITDLGGRFEWTDSDTTGDVLWINSIEKTGYLLSPKLHRGYAAKTGSLTHPVIFKMWKEGSKESLVGGSHVFGMDSGKTYTLNLVTGKKIEGDAEGDLRVSITRPPDAKPRDKFPWSFSIEVIGGGLVEADPFDEFMYLAPESGYEPKIAMQFDPNDSDWIGIVKKQFFIRSRNGQVYGRAEIEIDSIYNVHSALQIDYAINPNGSRNLEPK